MAMAKHREWQAAGVYLLILVLVVNVHFIGLADISLYGINISIYSLLAYILYSLFLAGSSDNFVRHHLIASVGTFFVYFFLSSLYSGMMFVLGYQVNVISWPLLQQANFATWVALGPLLAILVHTLMSAVRGVILSLQTKDPDGRIGTA
jgi:cellulose synthase/poly-beta-1,6-N-acetylglucosamine synthase-like glycosyltransferase